MTTKSAPQSVPAGKETVVQVRLSLVIPAYNEALRIADTLRRVQAYFQGQDYAFEIIVVDDGSTDATAALVAAQFPAVRLVSYRPNRGKGHAVKVGMEQARGRFRFFYDADGSTPIEEVEKAWPLLDAGADIVIGSRSLPDSTLLLRQNILRETMGRTFNLLVKAILGERVIDTQCGFKGFNNRSAEILFEKQTMKGFAFDAELLFLARKFNLAVKEIPVRWRNSPDSRVRMMSDSARMALDLLRIRWRDLRGVYR